MSSRTVPNTAEELLPRNTLRKSFVIQNEDASISVYIKRESNGGMTVSSTDHDHRIGPAGLISVNNLTDGTEAIQDRWTVIAASGTPRVSFFETEDIKR